MTMEHLSFSEAQRSRRISWRYFEGLATGFLDFARNDINDD